MYGAAKSALERQKVTPRQYPWNILDPGRAGDAQARSNGLRESRLKPPISRRNRATSRLAG
jgi:hypothetical protein